MHADPFRSQEIRRTLLEKLEIAEPHALPEPTLQVGLNSKLRPPIGQAEFDDALLFLQTRGFIGNLPDEIDENLSKWFITEAGKTLLRK